MIPNRSKAILSEFRMSRGQSEAPAKREEPKRQRKSSYSPYDSFKERYKDLEKYIDDFSTRDLMYYFREISEESGYRYVISNIKKDMAIMKRLKTNYSNREICGMIEFLYMSDQDYLEKDRLSPNLLASQWVNTIYADMQLWVKDKYIPRSVQTKKKKNVKQREWDKDVAQTENDVVIGGKL